MLRELRCPKSLHHAAPSEGGGETWAILSSLLNTARLNGVDPEAYLVDVLERMVSGRTTNDRLHELLAWNLEARSGSVAIGRLKPCAYRSPIGSGATSASVVSVWIASRINRSVVCSKQVQRSVCTSENCRHTTASNKRRGALTMIVVLR